MTEAAKKGSHHDDDARVIRKVEFRYGNLERGGHARIELLGDEAGHR